MFLKCLTKSGIHKPTQFKLSRDFESMEAIRIKYEIFFQGQISIRSKNQCAKVTFIDHKRRYGSLSKKQKLSDSCKSLLGKFIRDI